MTDCGIFHHSDALKQHVSILTADMQLKYNHVQCKFLETHKKVENGTASHVCWISSDYIVHVGESCEHNYGEYSILKVVENIKVFSASTYHKLYLRLMKQHEIPKAVSDKRRYDEFMELGTFTVSTTTVNKKAARIGNKKVSTRASYYRMRTLKLSVEAFSQEFQIPAQMVYKFETGQFVPKTDEAKQKYRKAYGGGSIESLQSPV